MIFRGKNTRKISAGLNFGAREKYFHARAHFPEVIISFEEIKQERDRSA